MSTKQPLGETKNAYGLKADGKIFRGLKEGKPYSHYGFSLNDTVGCGLVLGKREVFFTLNGKYLGPAFQDVNLGDVKKNNCKLFGAICLQSQGEEIISNFGGQQPFLFDLQAF